MSAPSLTPLERARKSASLVLQRMQPDATAQRLAKEANVSESTISRWKEQVEPTMKLVALLGLKVVDESRVCVPAGELAMLRAVYARASEQTPWLLNEEES